MKFSISRESFLTPLQQAVGVAEKKTTMPILANVKIEAKDGGVTMTATDLEVCLISKSEATVDSSGGFTLPAKSLFDITKEFPRDSIEFELMENSQMEIRSQKAQFRLVGLAPEDFPAFPDVQESIFVEVPSNTLREMIERTSFSISNDEMRYSLNGILFETVDDGMGKIFLRLVSTDGHRLSLVEHHLEGCSEPPFKDKMVLPKKGVLELKRLLDDSDDKVELGFDGNNGIVCFKNSKLYMRRIVGEFPDYNKVIPEVTKTKAFVNRQDFMGSLKRMLLMSSPKHKLVRFDFTSERLEMTSQNPELGTAHEEIELRYDGGPLTVGFNPKYFLDALSVIDEKEISIDFVDDLSPAVVHTEKDSYKCVIMPMRL